MKMNQNLWSEFLIKIHIYSWCHNADIFLENHRFKKSSPLLSWKTIFKEGKSNPPSQKLHVGIRKLFLFLIFDKLSKVLNLFKNSH